jgi:TonB family protein
MRLRFQILTVSLAGVAALCSVAVPNSFSQAAASLDTPPSGVVLARLSSPVYPLFAKRTMISGDVNLTLGIRLDGTVDSAVMVSGHPLLQQAALESAQKSQFECRGCTEAVSQYSLVYTFQLSAPDCPAPTSVPSSANQEGRVRAQVHQSQNHVTVIDQGSFCEGVFAWKVRSAKCLYLWKCGLKM